MLNWVFAAWSNGASRSNGVCLLRKSSSLGRVSWVATELSPACVVSINGVGGGSVPALAVSSLFFFFFFFSRFGSFSDLGVGPTSSALPHRRCLRGEGRGDRGGRHDAPRVRRGEPGAAHWPGPRGRLHPGHGELFDFVRGALKARFSELASAVAVRGFVGGANLAVASFRLLVVFAGKDPCTGFLWWTFLRPSYSR